MGQFYKLKREGNNYFTYGKVPFNSGMVINKKYVEQSFNFAYNMSFGKEGAHRAYRSGGQASRRNSEIFADAFQGKLSEFAFYEAALKSSIMLDMPDVDEYELGVWDSYDFQCKGKKLALKSTKFYGTLLLLETKDWDENGEYIPNIEFGTTHYDYFILLRIKPSLTDVLKSKRLLYSDDIEKHKLEELIFSESWAYDIRGYITHDDLVDIINRKFILPQNSLLNGKTKMDAENYYVQANNMRPIAELFSKLK